MDDESSIFDQTRNKSNESDKRAFHSCTNQSSPKNMVKQLSRPATSKGAMRYTGSRNSGMTTLNTGLVSLGKPRLESANPSKHRDESIQRRRKNYNLLSGLPKGITGGKYTEVVNSI